MATIGIYERVSSLKQDTASQHADLDSYARQQEQQGNVVVWYSDKATGKTMNRPGFKRLEDDLRCGKVQRVVVWRLDRLGRTVVGLCRFLEGCQSAGIEFFSVR